MEHWNDLFDVELSADTKEGRRLMKDYASALTDHFHEEILKVVSVARGKFTYDEQTRMGSLRYVLTHVDELINDPRAGELVELVAMDRETEADP